MVHECRSGGDDAENSNGNEAERFWLLKENNNNTTHFSPSLSPFISKKEKTIKPETKTNTSKRGKKERNSFWNNNNNVYNQNTFKRPHKNVEILHDTVMSRVATDMRRKKAREKEIEKGKDRHTPTHIHTTVMKRFRDDSFSPVHPAVRRGLLF